MKVLSIALLFLLAGCSTPQEKALSNYCLSFDENRQSFSKYSKCISDQRASQAKEEKTLRKSKKPSAVIGAGAICALTSDPKACMSGAMESISDPDSQSKIERKLRELEGKMSKMEREQRAKELQRQTDSLINDSRNSYYNRVRRLRTD